MTDQSYNDRTNQQDRIVPADLQPAEKDTLRLFDSLSSSLPDNELDASLLGQAAAHASDIAVTSGQQDGGSNVVSLYSHEREIGFQQVFPKVFVAAAVLVLAVVVVPLLNNSVTNPLLEQSAQPTALADTVEIPDEVTSEIVSETTAEISTETITDSKIASEVQDQPQATLYVDDTDASGPGANGELKEALDTEAGAISADLAEAEIAEAEVAAEGSRELQSDEQSLISEFIDPNNNTGSDAGSAAQIESDTSSTADVARTTIISTESAASPSVVQSINVTSAARVQREIVIDTEKATDESATLSSAPVVILSTPVSRATPVEENTRARDLTNADDDSDALAESPTDSFKYTPEDAPRDAQKEVFKQPKNVGKSSANAPFYRRSLHRWKAEILKFSRLGQKQQAELEYELFKQKHPSHSIEILDSVDTLSVDVVPVDPAGDSGSEVNSTTNDVTQDVEDDAIENPADSNTLPEQ